MTHGQMGEGAQNDVRWVRVDLHIHTTASEDYVDRSASFLDILKQAEQHNLEIIAFTDHNTIRGYEQMRRDIEFLETMDQAGRCTEEERERLGEYRRLLGAITVLPGFEFTSYHGAHILGIFPPETPPSLIEVTLVQLGVPVEQLKQGAVSLANTKHVTEAYEIIARNGGLVIAAHANGPCGVITEAVRLGASDYARVAVTQSPHLHALEFLHYPGEHEPFTSPSFYRGQHKQYGRPMFCIQGSDAHRLRRDDSSEQPAAIGDCYFEALLPAPSFQALRDLLLSQSFERVRLPLLDETQWEIDHARSSGGDERTILYSLQSGTELLWREVAALANVGGGVLVAGVGEGGAVEGVSNPDQLIEQLQQQLQLDPQPYLSFNLVKYEEQDVLRIEVNASDPPPYLGSDGAIYTRRDGQTVPANRAEVLQLARQGLTHGASSPLDTGEELELPRSGVEIVGEQRRSGIWTYEVRDLRTTAGVTRDRAQGLWAYAISRHEDLRDGRVDLYSQIKWRGRVGLWRAFRQGNRTKYDLVHRDENGVVDHIFYGVSDWGLGEAWQLLLNDRAIDDPEEVLIDDEPQQIDDPLQDLPQGHHRMEEHSASNPPPTWGDRQFRWKGRGGLWRVVVNTGEPRFDLAMKDKEGDGMQEFRDVPRHRLTEAWLNLIRISPPRTGIEVVAVREDEHGRSFIFRNMRSGEISDPWREVDLELGTVREYAARMFTQDTPLEEDAVRWWGNIGYTRPMRSQVDLVYRDENGVDHIYYAARRDELSEEWKLLLELWADD